MFEKRFWKPFIKGFLYSFIGMTGFAVAVVPFTLWLTGVWPAWALLSYFIIIPTFVGLLCLDT